jgi:hypothetical protein
MGTVDISPLFALVAPLLAMAGGVVGYFLSRKRVRKAAEDKAAESMSVTIRNLAGTVEDLTNTLHNDLPHIEDEIRKIRHIQGRMADHLVILHRRVSALEKRAAATDEQLPPAP